jgi:hypothetical protein
MEIEDLRSNLIIFYFRRKFINPSFFQYKYNLGVPILIFSMQSNIRLRVKALD